MDDMLEFISVPVPLWQVEDHALRGGQSLVMAKALLGDGTELRIMDAIEPVGKNDAMLRHVSVSVGKTGEHGPCRSATDEEVKSVLEDYVREPMDEDNQFSDGIVRHFWEKE